MRDSEPLKSFQKLVIYDGNCGLCQRLVTWASEKTVEDFKFIVSETVDPEQYGLKRKDFEKYVWLIQSDQKKIRGASAVAEILKAMGFGWLLLGSIISIPPFSFVANGIYYLVSENRNRFGNSCS
ncbi:MAG: DUF393 domain-containing protein [Actinomycetota bacterium]|nr:DUF393 domain-containing protein [Actinomycetota bacterium]